MKAYSRLLDPIFAITRWATVILVTLMVAVESYEISLRTITGDTPSWSKELVLLSMVWMGCLGAAVLHRERGHITLEFLVDSLAPGPRKWIMLAVDAAILAFSVFLVAAGSVVVSEFLNQSLPGTRMPVGVSYLPLPVTGLLLSLSAVEHMLAGLSGKGEGASDAA
jgi:TRAP-type C4-dicarboxylate transport system permease small subunit